MSFSTSLESYLIPIDKNSQIAEEGTLKKLLITGTALTAAALYIRYKVNKSKYEKRKREERVKLNQLFTQISSNPEDMKILNQETQWINSVFPVLKVISNRLQKNCPSNLTQFLTKPSIHEVTKFTPKEIFEILLLQDNSISPDSYSMVGIDIENDQVYEVSNMDEIDKFITSQENEMKRLINQNKQLADFRYQSEALLIDDTAAVNIYPNLIRVNSPLYQLKQKYSLE